MLQGLQDLQDYLDRLQGPPGTSRDLQAGGKAAYPEARPHFHDGTHGTGAVHGWAP